MSNRPLTDPCWLPSSKVSEDAGPPQKAEALREAYKRHSSELITIDELQIKLLLVMLGIFSAGATLLASFNKKDSAYDLPLGVQWGLTLIAVALLWLWAWFTRERHDYRQAVRDLLVRCELALGFYAKDAYLEGDALYTRWERQFPSKGGFMLWTHLATVFLAGIGFLLVLWSPRFICWLH
jgi:hypothetical protein